MSNVNNYTHIKLSTMLPALPHLQGRSRQGRIRLRCGHEAR